MKKLILMLMLCAPMTMMAQKFGKVNTQQIKLLQNMGPMYLLILQ